MISRVLISALCVLSCFAIGRALAPRNQIKHRAQAEQLKFSENQGESAVPSTGGAVTASKVSENSAELVGSKRGQALVEHLYSPEFLANFNLAQIEKISQRLSGDISRTDQPDQISAELASRYALIERLSGIKGERELTTSEVESLRVLYSKLVFDQRYSLLFRSRAFRNWTEMGSNLNEKELGRFIAQVDSRVLKLSQSSIEQILLGEVADAK